LPETDGGSGQPFRIGVNYWPARTAMGWWSNFDETEVAADFARIADCGLDSVRVFLTWEDFQPTPTEVDREMLERLVVVADLAAARGLAVMPTLFTGHMSGVNWLWEVPPAMIASAWSQRVGSRKLVFATGMTTQPSSKRNPSSRRKLAPRSPATRRCGRGTSATRIRIASSLRRRRRPARGSRA
jgi:aryl carrier-like protein